IERTWRWCRRNPWVTLLIAAIGLTLLAGTAFSTYYGIRATRGERLAKANETVALQRKDESDRRRYVAEFRWAMQKWKDGQIDEAQQILSGLAPLDDEPDHRGFEWYFLQRLCQLELRTLQGHSGDVFAAACSPDGRWLATASKDKTARIWECATGKLVHLLDHHEGAVFCLAFSPDGRWLATGGDDRSIHVWDAETGKETSVLNGHTASVRGLAFSPDGRRLASCGADKSVRIWELQTRDAKVLDGHTATVRTVVFSRDGHTLYSAGFD